LMMKLSLKLIATLVIGYAGAFSVHCADAENRPAPSDLVRRLQSAETTDQARKQLLQFGESDPNVREYLAAHLPAMIEKGPNSCAPSNITDVETRWHACPWYNAVELAGKLKIGEAAPSLGPWIAMRTIGGAVLGISSEARLDFYPAATALWRIGNPAIPTVQSVFDSGGPGGHFLALRVLIIINTPEAKAALREDLPREPDPELQAKIRAALDEK
jgi:hypothetical protein